MKRALLLLPVAVLCGQAIAADFSFSGYADGRYVVAPHMDAYLDGGLGKTRYGEDDQGFHLGDIVGQGNVQFSGEWSAAAVARIDPEYGPALDLIEAYVKYRPVSTNAWRWSFQAGAFFPPIALENDQLGWQPFWTITPSAINSWIGAELRIVGVQTTLEWRSQDTLLQFNGAIFGFNDPAGVAMADRGWNFDDRPSGLFDHYRLPDALSATLGGSPPYNADLYREIDHRPGWYFDASYEPDGWGVEAMTYDNNADPTKPSGANFAWHTTFWDFGAYKQIDGVFTLMGQAITGRTIIQPSPAFRMVTDFRSAYALAGIDLDKWWFGLRGEVFHTETTNSFGPSPLLSEDGKAYTLAANYAPETWLRLSAELLDINSTRPQRTLEGDPAHDNETQFQLLARVFY